MSKDLSFISKSPPTQNSKQLTLQDGNAKVKFTAPSDGPVAVAVFGPDGAKLADGLVQARAGSNEWSWNGRNGNGTLMRDGAYRVAVTGSSTDGTARAIPFTVLGTATAVEQKGDAIRLRMGALEVNFTDVKAVAPAATK